MNGNLKLVLMGLAVAALAACASAPQQRFASSVKAAQAANRPLVVYAFGATNPLTGYSFKAAKYNKYTYGIYLGIGVINAGLQPIQKLVLKVADYRGHQPILSVDGKLQQAELTWVGPLAPGGSRAMVTPAPVWMIHAVSAYTFPACPRLTGIKILYRDGSTLVVPTQDVEQYLTPQINVNCAVRYIPWQYSRLSTFAPVLGRSPPVGTIVGARGGA